MIERTASPTRIPALSPPGWRAARRLLHRSQLRVRGFGTVAPVVDRTFPLEEVPEALRYLKEGHARGKVVITV